MRRIAVSPRANLAARCIETGFGFGSRDGVAYWDESACYAFDLRQIEEDIEAPTAALAALCLELVDRVVGDERALARLRLPRHGWELIRDSWRRGEPSLYGRFDLSYGGAAPAKLLEYNADTPTALFEAAVFQWLWLEDAMAQNLIPADCDQFNCLHDKLIARLRHVKGDVKRLHLACDMGSVEDRGFVAYLADCARQAGLETAELAIADIGTRGSGPFVDAAGLPIHLLFKLYPWEWLLADPFGHSPSMRATRFVEPPWKAVLSSKAMLALLWEMAPRHPNLLPCFLADDAARHSLGGNYAQKPIFSREGANVTLVRDGMVTAQEGGSYGAEGFVWQALAPLTEFSGHFPVIGSWVVGNDPAGIGIREDRTPITNDASRFVPHVISG